MATVLDYTGRLPLRLSDRVAFSRATETQIDRIREVIDQSLPPSSFVASRRQIYEESWRKKPDGEGRITYESQALAPDSFRYFVFNFSGYNDVAHDLLSICSIAPPYLESFENFITSESFGEGTSKGFVFFSYGIQRFCGKSSNFVAKSMDEVNLQGIGDLLEKFYALDATEHEGIRRAIDAYRSLLRFWRQSDLDVIGLFAIVEMLLTHKPNDKEIGDSLSHQIRSKIKLLDKRFKEPLDYRKFGTPDADKIWSALYSYRSAVAHGDHVDFSSKNLRVLVNRIEAVDFLVDAVRTLLRHALREPTLLNSLKAV